MQQHQSRRQHNAAKSQTNAQLIKPVSLRVKLLIGFSVIFSLVFAGAFYWFYTFSTEKVLTRLRTDMRSTLTGAVEGVDVDELMSLYANGQRNSEGFSDDPRYRRQLDWFDTVHKIEPRVWLYTYVVGNSNTNRRVGSAAVEPGSLEIVYLVDLWSRYDPSKAAKFLESDYAGTPARQVLSEGQVIESPQIYTDRWGSWLSAFAPLRDDEGNLVAILGVDIEAGYVIQVQQAIRDRVLVSFIITYGILFVLIYVLSGVLTRHLTELAQSAKHIGAGEYDVALALSGESRFPDELTVLAHVFEGMVDSIRTREQLIREGKRAEDEMRLALQEERELNELKSRFVSMVSHELRTPLTVMRTSLELLERYGDLASEEKKQEYFQRGRLAIHQMTQLLEDVLTIGKAEAGKLNFNPTPINLLQFCAELVDEMQLGMGANHTIAFSSEGNCSEAWLDPNLLRSILTNLLSNAIKYSPVGSTVDFELVCLEDFAVFEIRDQGIGIPLVDQPRLFELFHRASNAGTVRGTGLGLAIVKQCVSHHNGHISFSSEEGVGTTFTVKLPLTVNQQSQEQD